MSVKVIIAVAILLTYSLQFYVPMSVIWKNCKHWFPNNENVAEYILRVVLVVLSGNKYSDFSMLLPW